jgi:hypothetical protein
MNRWSAGSEVARLDDVALMVALGKHQQVGRLRPLIAARLVILGGERPDCKAGSSCNRSDY